MVQVIEGKRGFGSRFSDAFNPAFQQGLGRFLDESAVEDKENRQAKRDREQQKLLLDQKKATAKALGLPEEAIEPAVQSTLLKEQFKDKRNQNLLERLGGGIGQNGGSENAGGLGKGSQLPQFGETRPNAGLSDRDILGIGVEYPQVGQLLQRQNESNREHEFKVAKENQKNAQGAKEFAHKETSKYAEKVVSDSDRAHEIIDAANQIKKITKKKGAVGANARNLAFSYLKDKKSPFANLFQSEDTQALISATKTLAGGGVKEIFAKPTEREFFWFENILPDILKDAPTNDKSASYFEKVANIALKRQEIFDDIVKKNKGYRPIDIDSQVREKMAPEMKKLVEEGEKLKKSQYSLEALPDASKYRGKTAEDDQGNRYKSNGTVWELL